MKLLAVLLGFACLSVAGPCVAGAIIDASHNSAGIAAIEGILAFFALILAALSWKWAAEL